MVQFIDEAEINVAGGNGGKGCVSFRREKYVPRGGPNGGDGGDGGNVVFVADSNIGSLLDFRYKKLYKAQRGEDGRGKNQHGKSGKDIIIPLPQGTIIRDMDSGDILCDLKQDGEQFIVAWGGKGGRGNARFATSVHQAPREFEEGKEGESRILKLELKLLADVGIVGFPNAGKSTLISKISAARPKIADYPFTTLIPNLGVVNYAEHKTFIVADIPGLIEGAHEGVGLGINFLKHIERTSIILYLIEISTQDNRDPLNDYKILREELKKYSGELIEKPFLVALNKIDTADQDKVNKIVKEFKRKKIDLNPVSAYTGAGVSELVKKLGNIFEKK